MASGRVRFRVRAVLLTSVFVLAATAGSYAPVSALTLKQKGADPAEAFLAKAGDSLRDAVSDGLTRPIEAIVTGRPHLGLSEDAFGSRAEARRALEQRSAPFFAEVEAVLGPLGGEVLNTFWAGPAVHVSAPVSALQVLAGSDSVRFIDETKKDDVRVIEPIRSDSPGSSNTGGRQLIEAEEIWALGYMGEGIKLSVIDTGIDPNHEAFKAADGSSRIVAWTDTVNNRTTPYDDMGHGTHVAGTAAGSDLYVDPVNGKFQEVGVAPRVTILGAKFLDATGGGSFPDAITALQWSFNNGADITSNSWGARGSSGCTASRSVIEAVHNLTDLGMLSVFAAGNTPGTGTVGGPACGEAALSVGAIDQNLNPASFSSRGPCSDPFLGTPPRICPDVVAKGVDVRSSATRTPAHSCCWHSSGYIALNGTSMATPHVAGAAALSEQMKRTIQGAPWDTSARAEEQVFKLTAFDLGTPGEDNTFGWGLPKLLSIYALIDSTDEANIVDTFSISKNLVRLGDSTDLRFSVRNLGGAIASGTFRATLTGPDSTVTVLKESMPSLGLLDGETVSHTMTVGGNMAPGDYVFRGTFDYTWEGPGGPQSGSVVREGTISVKRVFVEFNIDGLDEKTLPGNAQFVTVTATNTGNEDAGNVVLELTVPDRYVFLPGDNLDPENLDSRYSNPTPKSVEEDSDFKRVTLVHEAGDLPQGASFSYTFTVVPTTPGEYRVVNVSRFSDGAGKRFSQGGVRVQQVGV